jgi:hypothetical protein
MRSGAQFGVLIIFLAITVATVIIVAVVRSQARQRRRREEALAVVAQRLGGTLTPGSFWQQPKITYEYKSYAASIEYYSTGGKNPTLYTRLFFHFQRPIPIKAHVYPERFFSRVGKFLGGQDIQIGDSLFDGKFMIKGSDQARVKDFLSPEVRQAIFELRALTMNDHVDVTAESTALRIQKLSWLHAPDLLMSLATLGQRVFEGYLSAVGGGSQPSSQFEGGSGDDEKTEIFCTVCKHVIEGSMHNCPKCGAPHHPECYELNDGCGSCS